MVAIYYNNAVLAPEVSGLGAGLIAMINQTRYWNMYRRKTVDSLAMQSMTIGWDTNRKTKPAMVGLMQKALKDGYIKIRSQKVLEEMVAYRRTITKTPDGHDSSAKMSAPPGKNDDACVAMMIANAVAHHCPGGGSEVRSPSAKASSADHNEWSADEWAQYEKWQTRMKARMSQDRR